MNINNSKNIFEKMTSLRKKRSFFLSSLVKKALLFLTKEPCVSRPNIGFLFFFLGKKKRLLFFFNSLLKKGAFFNRESNIF